jgi:hypothetical protein
LSTVAIQVDDSPSDLVVSVTVYRTFEDGTSIVSNTYFVYGNDTRKHRFVRQEIEILVPAASIQEFAGAKQ